MGSVKTQGSPILNFKILGEEVSFLVDTGARECLTGAELWSRIKNKVLEQKCRKISQLPRLIGVTGHPLKLSEAYEVPVRIGTHTVMMPLLCCESTPQGLGVDGLMGCNLLQSAGIDVLSGERLRIGNEIIPLENASLTNNCNPVKQGNVASVGISKHQNPRVEVDTSQATSKVESEKSCVSVGRRKNSVKIKTRSAKRGRNNKQSNQLREAIQSGWQHTHTEPTTDSNDSVRSPVFCVQETELQPRCEQLVPIRIERPANLKSEEVVFCRSLPLGINGVAVANTMINPEHEKLFIQAMNLTNEPVKIPRNKILAVLETGEIPNTDVDPSLEKTKSNKTDPKERTRLILEQCDINLPELSVEHQNQFKQLIKQYQEIFHLQGDALSRCKYVEHHIELKEGAKPINKRPYPVPHALKPELDRHIKEMLDQGIIKRCRSNWGAPCLVIPKKAKNETRFVVDLRNLNANLVEDCYPLPRIDELLYSMGPAKYFSSMDMQSGFFQISLDEC